MIQALLWDIGGVLIEDPRVTEFWKDIPGSENLRAQFGMREIDRKEFIQKGATLMNLSQKDFLEKYKKLYWTGKRNASVIKIFKNNSLRNYIYSDTNPIHLQYLNKIGKDIFQEADKVITDKRKKYAKSYTEVLAKIEHKPSEVIFIDNKEDYIEIARKKGINAILYKNSVQLKKDLKQYGIDV